MKTYNNEINSVLSKLINLIKDDKFTKDIAADFYYKELDAYMIDGLGLLDNDQLSSLHTVVYMCENRLDLDETRDMSEHVASYLS